MANGWKRLNAIEVIEDDAERHITNEDRKRTYFFQKFQRLFEQVEEGLTTVGDWSSLYQSNRLPNRDLLTTPFTLEEVKTATFQLGSDKALGPDGFLLIFYQTFLESVKEDIFNVFIDLQENRLFTGPVDYAYVCLILKKEGARKANDFRSISLINGIQKIISEVLANRLALILLSIITSSQSAFHKDYLLTHSFVTATELVNWCSKSSKECASIKVDFEKAFNNVKWTFLQSILRWLRFSDQWWIWVEQCICKKGP